MKNLDQWFSEYAESHQNETNQKIHFICVPAIFFSIVGLVMSIPHQILNDLTGIEQSFVINWATPLLFLVYVFYLRLSFKVFLQIFIFSIICLAGNFYISHYLSLAWTSLGIFIIAWIGQFYGHKVEGKKPSFFQDLQFLLIGPAWVFEKVNQRLK